jgi:crotonobetainyl-CoA:carnitine CoA-transferase CaiB-like acyl-CoA transferase
VMSAPELLEDARFATSGLRSHNRDALTAEIERRLAAAESATWIARLNEAGVPCGRIYSVDEVFADPQVQSLGMVASVPSPHYHPLRLVAQPMRLSRTPSDVRIRPPECGEHTMEILGALGYSQEEIAGLRRRQIV